MSENTIPELPELQNGKEYKIFSGGEEYSLKIGKSKGTSYVTFILKQVSDTSETYDIGEYTLHKLLDLNKAFWLYESVLDALKEIQSACDKKTPSVIVNKNGTILLIITIENYLSVDEVKFQLIKKTVVPPPEEENEGILDGSVNVSSTAPIDPKMMNKINEIKSEISQLRGEINLLKISIDSKDDKIYQRHLQLLEKIRNREENKKTIDNKDLIIDKLNKRIEVLENINKLFEEFMNKEKK